MADGSTIQWTDATWQITTGCTVVSPGCTNCYAMRVAGTRLRNHPSRVGLTQDSKAGPVWTGEVRFNEQWLDQPLRWKRARRIFVCAHGDLFHESVPDEAIDKVFAVMALAPHHTFQILTKRAKRMREYFAARQEGDPWAEAADYLTDLLAIEDGHAIVLEPRDMPLPNVWLGVSVEDQTRADERIPDLLATPAAVRFISAEPLLGPVHLGYLGWPSGPAPSRRTGCSALTGARYENGEYIGSYPRLDWCIVGGESGQRARRFHVEWAESLLDQCRAAGTAFFMKQMGTNPIGIAGTTGKGDDPMQWPATLRVREMPNAR